MPLQLIINTLYYLYIRPLNSLTKPSFILNSISLLLLTAFKYRRVINRKPYLHYILANLNIILYPLAYITAQVAFKIISIIPYKITLTISALYTQMTYLFITITLLNTLSIFKRCYNILKTQGLTSISRNAISQLKKYNTLG